MLVSASLNQQMKLNQQRIREVMKEWRILKLGDIAVISYGYTAKASVENVGSKFLRITDIQNDMVNWSNVPYCQITEDDFKKYKLIDQDIVFARTGATTGKSYLVCDPPEAVAASYLIRLRVQDPTISAKFISKYFQTRKYWDNVSSGISGSAQGGFNASKLSALAIPIPPLPEQKRIVAILDEAFEGIDRAIANTEKNLTNSRELFESYLNAIFTQKGDGWVEKKLGDIATFRNGLNFTKSSKGESIKIVGVKDFQNHFWIQEEQLDAVTIDAELKEIDILRKGDILTVRSNGNKELIGRCILAGDISEKTSHSGFTIRIRIESENIYPQFIVYSLKSRHIRKQLIESGGGISISSLNQQGLSLIILSFPTFVEQKAIVANIDQLAAETQRLETIYRQKIAALNELKQSILQKAFTGELTADTLKTAKEEIAA